MENVNRKILIKILVAVVLTVLFIILYFSLFNKDYSDVNSTSYSGDNRMELNVSKYYMRDIKKFFSYVESDDYNSAFEILNDKCKENEFSNNLKVFENTLKTVINSNICEKKIEYQSLKVEKENWKKVYVVNGIIYFEKMSQDFKGDVNSKEMQDFFTVKKFTFKVYEEKPFNFKYYLVLE